jgi:hypothetical protein
MDACQCDFLEPGGDNPFHFRQNPFKRQADR